MFLYVFPVDSWESRMKTLICCRQCCRLKSRALETNWTRDSSHEWIVWFINKWTNQLHNNHSIWMKKGMNSWNQWSINEGTEPNEKIRKAWVSLTNLTIKPTRILRYNGTIPKTGWCSCHCTNNCAKSRKAFGSICPVCPSMDPRLSIVIEKGVLLIA